MWQPFLDPEQFQDAHTCRLGIKGWPQLFARISADGLEYTEGGLGPSRVAHIYLQWICLKGNIPWPDR